MTYTPDPIYSRNDRISGVLTWRDQPLSGIAVDLYNDVGPWCARRPALQHTVTDGLGRYYFLNVEAGTYWLGVNSNNMDSGAGLVPSFAWVCTERMVKDNTPRTYSLGLTKKDVKIIFPSQGISFNNTMPVFSWEPYPDAAYYTILLDLQATTWQRIENDTRTDTTMISPRSPLALGKYSLRVYAWDAQRRRMAYGDVNFAVQ